MVDFLYPHRDVASFAGDSRGFRLSPRGKPAKYTRQGTGLGGGDVRGEVWFGSFFKRLVDL